MLILLLSGLLDVLQGYLGFQLIYKFILNPLLSEYSHNIHLLVLIELLTLQHIPESHLSAPNVFIHLTDYETALLDVTVLIYEAASLQQLFSIGHLNWIHAIFVTHDAGEVGNRLLSLRESFELAELFTHQL